MSRLRAARATWAWTSISAPASRLQLTAGRCSSPATAARDGVGRGGTRSGRAPAQGLRASRIGFSSSSAGSERSSRRCRRSQPATNLPRQPTPLFGREREVAEIEELLLREDASATVTGPGGSGKTRLAIEVAAELVDDFRDGVYWVALAGIATPTWCFRQSRSSLGARQVGGVEPSIPSGSSYAAGAAVAARQLRAGNRRRPGSASSPSTPSTKVLLTSRAALRLR